MSVMRFLFLGQKRKGEYTISKGNNCFYKPKPRLTVPRFRENSDPVNFNISLNPPNRKPSELIIPPEKYIRLLDRNESAIQKATFIPPRDWGSLKARVKVKIKPRYRI